MDSWTPTNRHTRRDTPTHTQTHRHTICLSVCAFQPLCRKRLQVTDRHTNSHTNTNRHIISRQKGAGRHTDLQTQTGVHTQTQADTQTHILTHNEHTHTYTREYFRNKPMTSVPISLWPTIDPLSGGHRHNSAI